MKLLEHEIKELFEKAAQELFPGAVLNGGVSVTQATNEKFGDFQTNFAMVNAKSIGKNPREIAQMITDKVGMGEIIEKLEIAGPGFINIFVRNDYLAKYTNLIGKEKADFTFIKTEGDVIIDYSSPNIAKRMHIGHLRSTIIGDSIKRIYQYLGYNVVADNHIGDWGTQFGKLIVGYRKWVDMENYKNNAIEELERIYIKFTQEAENAPELEDEARAELKKLQDGDSANTEMWKEFIKVSLDEYGKLYNRMGISFDTYYGESFYNNMMPAIVEELEKKGLAVESEGAKVVFFDEKENLHPCIVQKKDGAYLYATSDLACLNFRQQNYKLNKVIYVTDERQQDHFRQFFKVSEKAGWNIDKEHVWFGIMRFADGIFSTRKGNVIKLEELLDEAKRRAYETVKEKNPGLDEEEKQNIAEVVGMGAVKYADLSQNRISAVIFEWDKILSFEGNTAPYLQYSYARIKSILRKAREEGLDTEVPHDIIISEKQERDLAVYMTQFPNAVIKAAEGYRPNIIADYLFELSKKFNTFYNALSVLKAESEEIKYSRLALAAKAADVIKEGLGLLGIKTVERM